MCHKCANPRVGVVQSDHSLLPATVLDREKYPRPAHMGHGYIYFVKVRYDDGIEEWVPTARTEALQ